MNKIYLREILREDLSVINRWRADKELIDQLCTAFRYIGPEIDERWFDGYMAGREKNIRLAICASEDDRLLGVASILGIDWVGRSAEFSIQIGEKDMYGKGIGELATRMVVHHAFLDLNLGRLYLMTLAENSRAINLYRKIGFVEEGCLRKAIYKNGEYKDQLVMALLKVEYKSA